MGKVNVVQIQHAESQVKYYQFVGNYSIQPSARYLQEIRDTTVVRVVKH